MNFVNVKPGGFLSNYIRQYSFMEFGVEGPPVTERVIPTDGVQIMFHYKDPFVIHTNDGKRLQQSRSVLSGLTNCYSDVSTNGETGVVFIQFYPHSACHFFRFPLAEIENRSVDLTFFNPALVREVEEKLGVAVSVDERARIIDGFLQKQFNPIPAYDELILKNTILKIKLCNGQIPVSRLSDQLSVTTKSLERKFSRYLGKTTKQYMKIVRYQHILQNLSIYKNLSLTEHAYMMGYFDQSHFIRDFKNFTGFTPLQFKKQYPDHSLAD